MTFGADHFVAMLKLKKGEKLALTRMEPAVVPGFTPYFEIVAIKTDDKTKQRKTLEQHLKTAFAGLGPAAGRFPRYFLDTQEIEFETPAAAGEAFRRAADLGIPFTPATGLSRGAIVPAARAAAANGIALRVTRADFERGQLPGEIVSFLATNGLELAEVDLVLDLGDVGSMVASGVARMARAFLFDVPDPRGWRTLSMVGSAFPVSMKGIERNSCMLVDRVDWLAWRSLRANRAGLARLPTFGDYAIQHPTGVEGFDFRKMQVSATIRYTVDERWLFIKGESTGKTRAAIQFPQLARRLVSGDCKTYFMGARHCPGCAGIAAAAAGAEGFGSAGAWRCLGTIHHITNTVAQMNGLPAV